MKNIIAILLILLMIRCENKIPDKISIVEKSAIPKKDKKEVLVYQKSLQGIWYVPTLSKSFIEIKGNNWYTQSEEFNIMVNHEVHWLNSYQLELKDIKNRDTISIIELTQEKLLYIGNNSQDTICLVRTPQIASDGRY